MCNVFRPIPSYIRHSNFFISPHEASTFARSGTSPVRRRNRFPFLNPHVLQGGNRFPLMKPQYLRRAEQALCEGGTGSPS